MVFGLLEELLSRKFPSPPTDGLSTATFELFERLIEDIKDQLAGGLPERFVERLTATCESLVGFHGKSTFDLKSIYEANEKAVKAIQEAEAEEQDEHAAEENDRVTQNSHIFRVFCARTDDPETGKYIEERGVTTIGRLPYSFEQFGLPSEPLRGQTQCYCEVNQGNSKLRLRCYGTVHLTRTHLCFEETIQPSDDTDNETKPLDPFLHAVALCDLSNLRKKQDGSLEIGENPKATVETDPEPEPEPEPGIEMETELEAEQDSAAAAAAKVIVVILSDFPRPSLRDDMYRRICNEAKRDENGGLQLENVSGSEWEGIRKMHSFAASEQMLHKYECRVDLPGPKKWGVLYLSNGYVCYQCDAANPPLSLVCPFDNVADCSLVKQGYNLENLRENLRTVTENLSENLRVTKRDTGEQVEFIFDITSKQRYGARHAHATIQSCIEAASSLTRTVATTSAAADAAGADGDDGSPSARPAETYELGFETEQGYPFLANTVIKVAIVGSLATHTVPPFSSADVLVREGFQKYRFPAPRLGDLQKITVEQQPRSILGASTDQMWVLTQARLMEESTTRAFTFEFTKVRPLQPSEPQTVGPPAEGPGGVVMGLIVEECFENEVLHPRTTGRAFLRERWTDESGDPRLKDSFELPDESWVWGQEWTPEAGMDDQGRSLSDGWWYALTWDGAWAAEKGWGSQVRRRRWIRVRKKTPT